jgi:hypothetical protein
MIIDWHAASAAQVLHEVEAEVARVDVEVHRQVSS